MGGGASSAAQGKAGSTALICASNKGHTEIAQALLAAGADKEAKDRRGNTALLLASYKGQDRKSVG